MHHVNVPPQPNPHLTMSSARIDPPEASLGSKKKGLLPRLRFTDSRKSRSQSVPRRRHEAVRLATLAAQAARQQSTGSELGPRAQPSEPILFPVTDPFCRLPLPTLFHRPEAVHLGDLMRL
ncbi:unnamed protein product [Brassica napus]|nr:unnamed protein product [Brassica napus]